ncbi:MAG: hypothetical protein PHW87_13815, partial [Methanothrix sp.]|nr:hypothetical protein [Methanothrix sp.]
LILKYSLAVARNRIPYDTDHKKSDLQNCSAPHSQHHLAFRFCRANDAGKKIEKSPENLIFTHFHWTTAF